MEWIKKIWKDPVGSKVISVGIIAAIGFCASKSMPVVKEFFLQSIPLWTVLVFILMTYLFTKVVSYYKYKGAKEVAENKHSVKTQNKAWQDRKNLIWKAFIGLGDKDLTLLMNLYNLAPIDPENEHTRMISQSEHRIYDSIIEKTNIPVASAYQRAYMACITLEYIGDKVHYTFDQYFYSLLMYYASSGQKQKL